MVNCENVNFILTTHYLAMCNKLERTCKNKSIVNNNMRAYYKNDNLVTFVIDNVFARNWIISNLEANFLIMTTPDLNKFGFNKSLKVKNNQKKMMPPKGNPLINDFTLYELCRFFSLAS